MKVLVVLCAVVASCLAKPTYLAPASYSYSSSVVSVNHGAPAVYAAPAPAVYAAHAPTVYAAPAPAVYAAPAPAPIAYTAPASTVVTAPVAPAPVAYAAAPAVVAAPAPVAPVVPAPAPAPVAYAAPAPVAPVVAAAPAAVKSQYHAQNEHGEASYGHAEPGQVHNAVQDAHGNKIGSFSYVNPEGHVLRTDYVADAAGYRVASNALPAAPAPLVHARRRRSVAVQTPASTVPLAYAAPAPLAYAAPAPLAYAAPAPLAYPAPDPLAYAAPAPLAYAAPVAPAPVAYAAAPAPDVLPATLTTVVNNPGHAVSYRVD